MIILKNAIYKDIFKVLVGLLLLIFLISKVQVEELEIRMIQKALEATGGNVKKAAEQLGVSRPGLHKKLTRYGIGS